MVVQKLAVLRTLSSLTSIVVKMNIFISTVWQANQKARQDTKINFVIVCYPEYIIMSAKLLGFDQFVKL